MPEMVTVGRIEINGEETLGHALKDRRLAMPINQREYAWTTDKHVPDLLGDLANAIAKKEPEYFLGSIVVTRQQAGRHNVIDGQQRLATTTILLAAIRDYFQVNNDAARARYIEERFLFDVDGRTLETSPRLILNRIDNEYFRRRILAAPGTPERSGAVATAESHDLIDAAAKFIAKRVKAIVSVAVRLLVVGGGGAGTMEANYSKWARSVRAGTITDATSLLKTMSSDVPSDSEFESAFAIARVSKAPLGRYYLCALERYKMNDPQPEFVPNTNQWEVDLEHVVPKSGIENGWDGLTPEEARALCRRIGNLALLRRAGNSLAGSEPFATKSPIYKASEFALTAEMSDQTSWGAEQVEKRQAALAALAVKTWPLKI